MWVERYVNLWYIWIDTIGLTKVRLVSIENMVPLEDYNDPVSPAVLIVLFRAIYQDNEFLIPLWYNTEVGFLWYSHESFEWMISSKGMSNR